MHKVSITNHALEQLRALPSTDQQLAATAITRLRTADDVSVHMRKTPRGTPLFVISAGRVAIVFRPLPARQTIAILAIFSHATNHKKRGRTRRWRRAAHAQT
jgi:hypothetical protein